MGEMSTKKGRGESTGRAQLFSIYYNVSLCPVTSAQRNFLKTKVVMLNAIIIKKRRYNYKEKAFSLIR